jgi:hypothetical protein
VDVCGDSTSKYLLFIIILLRIHTGGPWQKSNITYTVDKYPSSKLLQLSAVDEELEKALTTWADVAKLNFLSIASNNSADITVTFVSRDHGDGSPFDGKGMVVAHASAPPSGKVHFDDDERWTIRKRWGEIVLCWDVTLYHWVHGSQGTVSHCRKPKLPTTCVKTTKLA